MKNHLIHKTMIAKVAKQLGPELCSQVAFLGGSTTSLHVTDPYIQEQVRGTEDVDIIISVLNKLNWYEFCKQLKQRSFKQNMNDEVICRFRLGQLIVDVMPDDPEIIGFSNPWYSASLEHAQDYEIEPGVQIKLVTANYFLATKFAAFAGRGKNDLLGSQDIEDILNVIDGRETIEQEIKSSPEKLKHYISLNIANFLEHTDLSGSLQSHCEGDDERIQVLYERLVAIANITIKQ